MLPLGWQDRFFTALKRVDPSLSVMTQLDMGAGTGTGAYANVLGRGVSLIWDGDKATVTVTTGPVESFIKSTPGGEYITATTMDDPDDVVAQVQQLLGGGK